MAAQGDKVAFSKLFYDYKDRVYSIALRLTDAEYLAEEVVQEVFMKLWQKREILNTIAVFEDYLFIMTRNCVFKALKRIAMRNNTETGWQIKRPLFENETENDILDGEYEAVLRRAIDLLPPQQKKVFLLSRDDKMKREEIANLLQVSPETVKTHLSRALQHVRAYCQSRLGVELPLCFFLITSL